MLILLLASFIPGADAFAQFQQKHSHVQWNGLGFIKGTNYFKGQREHCGVYSSEGDRQSGKLSLAINCRAENHKLKVGFVKDQSAIKIIREDETHSFLHRDIYGYRDCNGNEFHFFNGKAYELVNPGEEIPIYRDYRQKGKQRVARLYFATRSGDLKSLTFDNFKHEFSDEPLFLEKLHILARNNHELIKYLYLINRIRLDVNRQQS